MRKVSEEAHSAFINKKRYQKDNTLVDIVNGEAYMYLFSYLIAKTEYGNTYINHCNKKTRTTRDRLDCFVNIRIAKGKFIVNEKFIWEEGWLNINELD